MERGKKDHNIPEAERNQKPNTNYDGRLNFNSRKLQRRPSKSIKSNPETRRQPSLYPYLSK